MRTLSGSGAPGNGTNQAWTISTSGSPSSGGFKLKFRGYTTALIAYNAAATAVRDALRALPNIGTSGISGCTGGALPGTPVVCTAGGDLAKRLLPNLTVTGSTLNTGSASSSISTPGVTATGRDAPVGTLYSNDDNGDLYHKTTAAGDWAAIDDSSITVPCDAVADVATADADATYGTAERDLINELKAQLNDLLASLRSGGILDT